MMLAVCGLACGTCPIHLATREPDEGKRGALRAEIARQCVEQYSMPMAVADVTDCDGCRAGGRLFSGCRNCRIRPCALGRGLEICAACEDYACAVLLEHFARDPTARDRLEQVRRTRGG
jgi:hypothetical protein